MKEKSKEISRYKTYVNSTNKERAPTLPNKIELILLVAHNMNFISLVKIHVKQVL